MSDAGHREAPVNGAADRLLRLGGRVVAVTGGASGIGRAVALVLARVGAIVVAGDRDAGGLATLREEAIGEALDIEVVQLDVTDPGGVQNFVSAAGAAGCLSGVVNSAGVAPAQAALDVSLDDWHRVIEVNLTGTFLVSQAACRVMREHGRGGSIVNVGSAASVFGPADLSHYSASKAGVVALTKSLAREWGPYRIRVNTVSPGAVDTPLYWDRARFNDDISTLPLARLGQPDDLASAILFFVSDMSSWITGQSLLVNGGSVMQ